MDLLLASTSPIRAALLTSAGVPFRAVPPHVDEAHLKEGHEGTDEQLAADLASAKARAVSSVHGEAWVVGSDSLVSVEGRRFSKPASREEAAEHLRFFSGRTMILTSAVSLARSGVVNWTAAQQAGLAVRPLSDSFIAAYLDLDWPEVSYCVGVFRLEGPGVQLFERIEGDHFTILGIPLLPLLGSTLR